MAEAAGKELGSGSFYRGYTLWRVYYDYERHEPPSPERTWHAQSMYGFGSEAWFTGGSPEEVAEKIDAALAELPVPVY